MKKNQKTKIINDIATAYENALKEGSPKEFDEHMLFVNIAFGIKNGLNMEYITAKEFGKLVSECKFNLIKRGWKLVPNAKLAEELNLVNQWPENFDIVKCPEKEFKLQKGGF